MVATRAKPDGSQNSTTHQDTSSSMKELASLANQRKRPRNASLDDEPSQARQKSKMSTGMTSRSFDQSELASSTRSGLLQPTSQDNGSISQDSASDLPDFGVLGTTDVGLAPYDSINDNMSDLAEGHDLAAIGFPTVPFNSSTGSHQQQQISAISCARVRLFILPSLDSLATQLLKFVAELSGQALVNIATAEVSDVTGAFYILRDLFDQTKLACFSGTGFIDAKSHGINETTHVATIKRANIATFIASIIGSHELVLPSLESQFMHTFLPHTGDQLTKPYADFLFELKSQAFISASNQGVRDRQDLIDEIFPSHLDNSFQQGRNETRLSSAVEREFVQRIAKKRSTLAADLDVHKDGHNLTLKNDWLAFLKLTSSFVVKNMAQLVNDPSDIGSKNARSSSAYTKFQHSQTQSRLNLPLQSTLTSVEAASAADDIAGKAQRAAQFAMRDYDPSKGSSGNSNSMTRQNGHRLSSKPGEQAKSTELLFHYENTLHPNVPGPQISFFQTTPYHHDQWPLGDANAVPYPTQSAPTQVLYERARQAASSKAAPVARKSSSPGQRRPWTLEEENALMAGLDRVKGPHWSQILAMFGPGGTISNILRDRNQVQLKDKARNLKLFFLKNNHEVPYYLQFVTGELKTRAPAQVAKNEAKGKRISEEDRAHVEGVMALASGVAAINGDGAGTPSNLSRSLTNGTTPINEASNEGLDPNLVGLGGEDTDQVTRAEIAEILAGQSSRNDSLQQQQQQQVQQARQDQFHYLGYAHLEAHNANRIM